MISKIFKEDKGFSASDALIAVLIITLFVGLISTISYNIYLANSSIKRMSQTNSYIVDIFEYINKIYYDDVNVQNLANYFNANVTKFDIINENSGNEVIINSNDSAENIVTLGNANQPPYKIEITINYYNKQEGNTDKFDLVKEITAKVTYKLGNRTQEVEMKMVKQRENLEVPNEPDLSKIELLEGEEIYPIKKEDTIWKVCNLNDKSWYNYEKGNWAVVFKTTDNLEVGDIVIPTNTTSYFWIPRYAYNSSSTDIKLKFLFGNTNKCVESYTVNEKEYKKLVDKGNGYERNNAFKPNNLELDGIWLNNVENNTSNNSVYVNLNSVYSFKNYGIFN